MLLTLPWLYFILKDKILFYQEHQQVIEILQQKPASKPLVVVVPDYLFHSRNYFLGYQPTDSISFIRYSEADSTAGQNVQLLLINHNLNHNPSFHQPGEYEHILEAAGQKQLHWKSGPLALYEL
ncbi:hypothetical protein A3841_10320 [Pontibacter flavimaris]|uniref:Uncharacterized protein n=1 Tax=Pontibacter flavimaris TaxID=1797110 RepID=A0A1Q5PGU4_9BACT|nr:hypothetical protein A3841_10320 [Pontibacter flavimaris]